MGLSHESLVNYYMTNFTIMYDLKDDVHRWDNFMPFEKSIYLDLLLNRLKEKENKNNRGSSEEYIPTEEEFRGSGFHDERGRQT